jgi:endonuclease YncB( thermonuclease family)
MWHLSAANARVEPMRKWVLAGLGASGLLLGFAVAAFLNRVTVPQSAETAAIAQLPASSSARELARATAPVEAPPAAATEPDLPTVDVAPRPIHTVPDENIPAPKVTLFDRAGHEIATHQPVSAPPPPPAHVHPVSASFIGSAQAAGGTKLAVSGRTVRLFGVRVADPRDQCGLGPRDKRSCAEVARDALAQRLRRSPWVSCQMPPGQVGDPGAVCVDASSTDLGGFLVAEGLALADTSQSYEYFGAEGVARSFHRGLWRHR